MPARMIVFLFGELQEESGTNMPARKSLLRVA
jgi:hypothetical protein